MKFKHTGGLIAHSIIHKYVPTNEQGSNETPGEGTTGTENMSGYGCVFCDMRFTRVYDLIAHLPSHVPTNEQGSNDTPGEGTTSTENMSGYGCAFCDMTYTRAVDLIAHYPSHVPTEEQGSNDTHGEGATGTENMPGYGCAFCDMSYAHSGELISHLMNVCAANKWQDPDGAPDGFVEWTITGAGGRSNKDLHISDAWRNQREQYLSRCQESMTRLKPLLMYKGKLGNVCKSPHPHRDEGF